MASILAVGINLMDKYLDQGIMYPGGNELNVAVYASRQGHSSAFMGVFGTDKAAPYIRSVLEKEQVDCCHCRVEQGETGDALVKLVDGERIFCGHNDGGVTGKYPIHILPEDLDYIHGFEVASTSLYGRMPAEEVINLCNSGLPVSYDFSNHAPKALIDALLPHLNYAFFSCAHLPQQEIMDLLYYAKALGCPCCIATQGERGAHALYQGHMLYQPAIPVAVVDTMGAGDSFIATLLTAHAADPTLGGMEQALMAAANYASSVCMQNGAIGYSFPLS